MNSQGELLVVMAVVLFLAGCAPEVRPPPRAEQPAPVAVAEQSLPSRMEHKEGPALENGRLTLSWNPVEGAEWYNIYYSSKPEEKKKKIDRVKGERYTVTGLVPGTRYYFTVTSQNRTGESIESVRISAVPRLFSPRDLPGTWHFTLFMTGRAVRGAAVPAWIRGDAEIDGTGRVVLRQVEQNRGSGHGPAGLSGLELAVTPDGAVSARSPGGAAVVEGKMGTGKEIIAGTASGEGWQGLLIMQKKRQVSFSPEHLTERTFLLHGLAAGSKSGWIAGTGEFGHDRKIRMSGCRTGWGSSCPVPEGGFSVDDEGTVRLQEHPSFKGTVSADRSMVVVTGMAGDQAQLLIYQVPGEAVTLTDLTGTYCRFSLDSRAGNSSVSTLSVSSAGEACNLERDGQPGGPMRLYGVDRLGRVIDRQDALLHGALSSNRDVLVTTGGESALSVAVK